MIKVYYAKMSPFLEEDIFLSRINQIEEKRRTGIARVQNPQAKRNSFFAGCLLHDALCKELGFLAENTASFRMMYEENGKPYLKDYPDLHFNLSHSGEYVCCALSDAPVGIDVQKLTDVKDGIARRFFTAQDNFMLAERRGHEQEKLFFRMWSIKESYVKLTGRGIGQGLSGFEIDWENCRIIDKDAAAFFVEQSILPGYALCVCSWKKTEKIEWQSISFES